MIYPSDEAVQDVEQKTNIELFYSLGSQSYIIVNHDSKSYILIDVKWKGLSAVENVLNMKISKKYDNIKDFKTQYKGYK